MCPKIIIVSNQLTKDKKDVYIEKDVTDKRNRKRRRGSRKIFYV